VKYKTIIELVCDAKDEEDASYTAGEYLRGTIDTGVNMRSRTIDLAKMRLVKCGISMCLLVLLVSVLTFNATVLDGAGKGSRVRSLRLPEMCTVQPVLKTSTRSAFKKNWEEKKKDFVLDRLKD